MNSSIKLIVLKKCFSQQIIQVIPVWPIEGAVTLCEMVCIIKHLICSDFFKLQGVRWTLQLFFSSEMGCKMH